MLYNVFHIPIPLFQNVAFMITPRILKRAGENLGHTPLTRAGDEPFQPGYQLRMPHPHRPHFLLFLLLLLLFRAILFYYSFIFFLIFNFANYRKWQFVLNCQSFPLLLWHCLGPCVIVCYYTCGKISPFHTKDLMQKGKRRELTKRPKENRIKGEEMKYLKSRLG